MPVDWCKPLSFNFLAFFSSYKRKFNVVSTPIFHVPDAAERSDFENEMQQIEQRLLEVRHQRLLRAVGHDTSRISADLLRHRKTLEFTIQKVEDGLISQDRRFGMVFNSARQSMLSNASLRDLPPSDTRDLQEEIRCLEEKLSLLQRLHSGKTRRMRLALEGRNHHLPPRSQQSQNPSSSFDSSLQSSMSQTQNTLQLSGVHDTMTEYPPVRSTPRVGRSPVYNGRPFPAPSRSPEQPRLKHAQSVPDLSYRSSVSSEDSTSTGSSGAMPPIPIYIPRGVRSPPPPVPKSVAAPEPSPPQPPPVFIARTSRDIESYEMAAPATPPKPRPEPRPRAVINTRPSNRAPINTLGSKPVPQPPHSPSLLAPARQSMGHSKLSLIDKAQPSLPVEEPSTADVEEAPLAPPKPAPKAQPQSNFFGAAAGPSRPQAADPPAKPIKVGKASKKEADGLKRPSTHFLKRSPSTRSTKSVKSVKSNASAPVPPPKTRGLDKPVPAIVVEPPPAVTVEEPREDLRPTETISDQRSIRSKTSDSQLTTAQSTPLPSRPTSELDDRDVSIQVAQQHSSQRPLFLELVPTNRSTMLSAHAISLPLSRKPSSEHLLRKAVSREQLALARTLEEQSFIDMISEPQIAAKLAAAAAHSIARQPSPQPSTESAPRRTATMRSQNAPPDDAEAEEFTPRGVPTGEGFRRAMSTRMVAVQTPLPPSRKPSETSLRKFVVLNHTEPMPSRRPTPEPRIPSRPTTPQVLVTAPSPPAASRKLSVESTLRRAFKPLEDSATSSLKPSRDSVFVPPAETRSRDPPPSSFPGLGAAQARALSKRPSMNHSHSQTESLAAVPPRASISVDSLQPFEAAILRVPTARPIPTVGGDLRRRATRHMAEQNHEARRIVEPTRSASMRHRTASAYNQGHSNYF